VDGQWFGQAELAGKPKAQKRADIANYHRYETATNGIASQRLSYTSGNRGYNQ